MTVEELLSDDEKLFRGFSHEEIEKYLDLAGTTDQWRRGLAAGELYEWSKNQVPDVLLHDYYERPLSRPQRNRLAAFGRKVAACPPGLDALDSRARGELKYRLASALAGVSKVEQGFDAAQRLLDDFVSMARTITAAVSAPTGYCETPKRGHPSDTVKIWLIQYLARCYYIATGKKPGRGKSNGRYVGPFARFLEAVWVARFDDDIGLWSALDKWWETLGKDFRYMM